MGVNISYVQDDIVLAAVAKDANIIAHGCNCFHVMGAGVAKRLADAFPEICEADKKTPYGDINKLGSFSKARDSNGMYITCTPNIHMGQKMQLWYIGDQCVLHCLK